MRALLLVLAATAALLAAGAVQGMAWGTLQGGDRIASGPAPAGASDGTPTAAPAAMRRAPLAAAEAVATPTSSGSSLDLQAPSERPQWQPVVRSCRHPAHVRHVLLATQRVRAPTRLNAAAGPRRTRAPLRLGGADAEPTDTSSLPV